MHYSDEEHDVDMKIKDEEYQLPPLEHDQIHEEFKTFLNLYKTNGQTIDYSNLIY